MNRFIVVVLDSFGVGTMKDVPVVRPTDIGANTALHLIKQHETYALNIPNLLKLGLMNALGCDYKSFKMNPSATFGTSNLKHFGADSYFGHQEIAGTNPKKPIFHNLADFIDPIEQALLNAGFNVERITKNNLQLLKVNNVVCVGDNMETDLGQAINVVGALDDCGMPFIRQVGEIVRSIVKVPRVIAFGGSHVTIGDIEAAILTKEDRFIGVDAPKSGVYKENYHVVHLGYGVDITKQVPLALFEKGVEVNLYGKTANIIHNPKGKNYDVVDTATTFNYLLNDLKLNTPGFYFLNIQETDLAGHSEDSERYIDRLNVSDLYLGKVMEALNDNDILIVMADHGNDPTIGHPRHTRERVPLLIYGPKVVTTNIGERETMSDVGQTVAEYFQTSIEHGTSFLKQIIE